MSSEPTEWSDVAPSEEGWYWLDSPYDGGLIVGHQTAPDLWFSDGKAKDPEGIKFGPQIPSPSELLAMRAGMEALRESVAIMKRAGWSLSVTEQQRAYHLNYAQARQRFARWSEPDAILSAYDEERGT